MPACRAVKSTIRSTARRRKRETRQDVEQRKREREERENGGNKCLGRRASAWMQKLEFGVWGRTEQIAGDE